MPTLLKHFRRAQKGMDRYREDRLRLRVIEPESKVLSWKMRLKIRTKKPGRSQAWDRLIYD
jgi:hypothetical protein